MKTLCKLTVILVQIGFLPVCSDTTTGVLGSDSEADLDSDTDTDSSTDTNSDTDTDSNTGTDECTLGTYDGDYYITSQDDVFALKGYTGISGHLDVVSLVTFVSLSDLFCLESIGGGLTVRNYNIVNLDGLDNLSSVGSLWIDLTELENIDALSSISAIEGNVSISSNDMLTSLAGLSNLESVGGELTIDGNSLTSLSHLSNLTSVGSLSIRFCDITNLEGLNSISSAVQDLTLYSNPSLTDVSALSNITAVNGSLNIFSNTALVNLNGLENLTSMGGELIISNNSLLTDMSALSNLATVSKLTMRYNNSLSNLDGLSGLTAVTGPELTIASNEALFDCTVCDLLDQLDTLPENTLVSNREDACSPAPENCP